MIQDYLTRYALKGLCITFVVVLGSLCYFVLRSS